MEILTEIKEHPIIFSGDMVRAILEGRKTQTRRVVKPQPYPDCTKVLMDIFDKVHLFKFERGNNLECPYGVPGDHLYVRESFVTYDYTKIKECQHVTFPDGSQMNDVGNYWKCPADKTPETGWYKKNSYKLRPSIHMPRWASRITLEVTNVRVERVQDISEEDCLAEGIFKWPMGYGFYEDFILKKTISFDRPHLAFAHLWDSINEKRGFGWDKNPWVWVVQFKVVGNPNPESPGDE